MGNIFDIPESHYASVQEFEKSDRANRSILELLTLGLVCEYEMNGRFTQAMPIRQPRGRIMQIISRNHNFYRVEGRPMSSRATVESSTHWNVREGLAKEVASDLTGGDSEVLAFLVHGEDPQTRRKKFDVLRQVAGLLHELVDNRRQQKWEALVEALTPDLDLSPTRIIEAQMLSSARVAVLESRDFVPAAA